MGNLQKRFQGGRAAGAGAAAPARRKSKYAGIKASEKRHPFSPLGDFVFEVVETFETAVNGTYFHATLKVVESENPDAPPGTLVTFLQAVDGGAMTAGPPRVKAFIMGVLGVDENEFDAEDPEGAFIDSCVGVMSPGNDTPNPLAGMFVASKVTRGKDVADGSDFYRNHTWDSVEQPAPAGGEAA